MNQNDFLRDLGFLGGERPSAAELKQSWKALGKKYHPDNKETGSEADFRRVAHAYKMLTDPEYRHRNEMQRMRENRNVKGDLNLKIQVPVTFDDAFFGREIAISYNRLELDDEGDVIIKEKQDLVYEKIRLPAGCVRGFEHLIPDGGHRHRDKVGAAVVLVMTLPHKRFKVEDTDVVSEERVPLAMLLKGGKVEVPTMYGIRTLKIPPGTAPGERLALPRCGIQRIGHHIVMVEAIYPSKDELRGQDWKGLEVDWGGDYSNVVADEDEMELLKLFETLESGQPPSSAGPRRPGRRFAFNFTP